MPQLGGVFVSVGRENAIARTNSGSFVRSLPSFGWESGDDLSVTPNKCELNFSANHRDLYDELEVFRGIFGSEWRGSGIRGVSGAENN
jgi:hypothetical protein